MDVSVIALSQDSHSTFRPREIDTYILWSIRFKVEGRIRNSGQAIALFMEPIYDSIGHHLTR
jgi:hypothetical protein